MRRLERSARTRPGRLVFVLVAATAGCVFEPNVPVSAFVRCGEDADCPPNNRCNLAALRCVGDDADVAPPIIEDVFFDPPAASGGSPSFMNHCTTSIRWVPWSVTLPPEKGQK